MLKRKRSDFFRPNTPISASQPSRKIRVLMPRILTLSAALTATPFYNPPIAKSAKTSAWSDAAISFDVTS